MSSLKDCFAVIGVFATFVWATDMVMGLMKLRSLSRPRQAKDGQ